MGKGFTNILTAAGKGDNPRHNYSQQFRRNFDAIDWGHPVEPVKPRPDSRRCWLCGRVGAGHEVTVARETPSGTPCAEKQVFVHFGCWMDMDA